MLGSIVSRCYVRSSGCAVEQHSKDPHAPQRVLYKLDKLKLNSSLKVHISDMDLLACCGSDCGYGQTWILCSETLVQTSRHDLKCEAEAAQPRSAVYAETALPPATK